MARPIVYGPAGSTYVWSTRLALAEKGVAHELVEIGFDEHREEPHLARHPFAKVPAFEHDGFALYETQAILRYIDEGFPVAPLQPTDLHELARLMGEQPYLAGERVSLADLMAIPLLYYFSRLPEGEAAIAEQPTLLPWIARMEGRQSFQVTKPPGI